FGKHLEDINVTWTQFGKKPDKNETLWNLDQEWFTGRGDGIRISIWRHHGFKETASQAFTTASK
nr:hypothetical protein [Tanacetum cinerariifolium]